MSTQPLIRGEGTAEARWRAWGPAFAPLDLTGCARLVVLAPHPDDEVLGVGGVIALAAAAGICVDVLAVTDGEASHPGSPTLTPGRLAAARAVESRTALADLGLTAPRHRLRIPDGHVAEHQEKVRDATVTLIGEPGSAADHRWHRIRCRPQ